MIPTLVILVLCLLVAMLTFSLALVLLSIVGEWRQQRRELRDHERRARHAERMAAQNGRPHSDAVLSRATRRRDQ